MDFNYSFSINLRVRYSETDQMGYCYYGNYAQYFEVGRVETLRSLGMSYKQLEDEGIMLPVSEFSVNYFAPAFYDNALTIETTITEIKGARIYFDYTITNESGDLICKAQTTLVFVQKGSMKPIPAPKSFTTLLQKYVQN
jgi:acyl-CoA thioester hydrolase